MSLSSPKRSHYAVHYQKLQQQQQQQHQHQQNHINRLMPGIRASQPYDHPSVSPNKSSSLSHLSRKLPVRSNSLPQRLHKFSEPLPPIPPFLFEEEADSQAVIIPPTRLSSLHKPRKLKKNQQDDEITRALLEWKHKSVFKVDWANMFSASVELWNMDDKIFGSMEDFIALKKDDEKLVQETADLLWLEDEQCVVPKKEIAAYIGKLDPFCHRVLELYMNQFDFTGLRLDEAFRKLCQKLYFKAEAQEIDRILEVFSYRFWSQNPDKQLYQNADVVYTIVYSIMLLNTDLHLVHISSHYKMTSDLFCKNTMATVLEQTIALDHDESWKERLKIHLKYVYASIKNQGVLQPVSEDDTPKSFLKRMGSMAQRKKIF